MDKNNKELCTKDKIDNEINFSVVFKKDGESFQNVMEKILINKITQP